MLTFSSQPLTPSTIGIIVGRDQVGDALIKLPFLRALRNAFPKAEIHWITSQGPTAFASLLRDSTRGLIDIVEEQPSWIMGSGFRVQGSKKPANSRTPIPEPYFDLLIDTRNRWQEALRARRIPHKVFVAMAMRYLFSDRRPPLFHAKPSHIIDRLLQLVELAAGYRPVSTGALPVKSELVAQARKIMPEGQVYVGLATGAGNPSKIWPRFKFEELAALQVEKGHIPVFILGPMEQADFAALVAVFPTAKFPLQDIDSWDVANLTIDHTLAIASLLDVAVANDSGVGHMLAAADCPLISLFGPTSPEKLAPCVSKGLVIRAQDFGGEDMKDIPWEAVDQAIDRMLRP